MSVVTKTSDSTVTTRLFYTTCLTFLLGVLSGTLVPFTVPVLLWLGVLALSLALIYYRSTVVSPRLLIGVVSCVTLVSGIAWVTYILHGFGNSPLLSQVGQTIRVEGVVVREPDKRARMQQLYVKVAQDTILVSVDRYVSVKYGDVVLISGTLHQPETFTTDLGRTFDYPGYLLARNVEFQISFADVSVIAQGEGNKVVSGLIAIKHELMAQIERYLPEPAAGLGEGLLLGVKQALGEDLETAFRQTGIIHIVVLSGYNVMLIVAFVMYGLSYVLPLRPRIYVGVVAILLFALMVGLSATVVRASLMAIILLLAQALGRTYLVLRGLLFAGVLMVMINPLLLVYDIGFQLSFMATLGLVLVAPLLERLLILPRWFSPGLTFFYATVATQLAVLPLLLYHIGELSIVSILVNMLVLPVVPIAMFFTFLVGVGGFFSASFASLAAWPAFLSLSFIVEIATWFAKLPFAAVAVPAFPFVLVLFAYVLSAGLLWRYRYLVKDTGQSELGEALVARSFDATTENSFSDWTIEIEPEEESHKKTGTAFEAVPVSQSHKADTPIYFR